MKKIFLTSGIILCAVFPAFATNINAGGTNATCTIDILGVEDGSTAFDAIWNANQYDVTYNPGTCSGTSYIDTDGATYDENYTALAMNTTNTTVPTGYTWLGWSTDSNSAFTRTGAMTGTITNAFTGATPWQRTSDLTVYGTCIANQYTVTYNVGSCGGSNYTHTNGATYGSNYSVPAAATSAITAPTGSTWVGWNTASGQSTANWTGATPWQSTSDLAVYAVCSTNSGTLTYTCGTQPGSATRTGSAPAGTTYNYGDSFTLATTPGTCAYTGWTFAGWKCNYNLGTGATYSGSTANYPATSGTITSGHTGTYSVAAANAAITCDAMWTTTENGVTVTWTATVDDENNEPYYTDGYDTTTCTYDSDVTLPSTDPHKIGYTFLGWDLPPAN